MIPSDILSLAKEWTIAAQNGNAANIVDREHEIAYHLNFADQSYFSKYFKKLTEFTPLAFRNHISTTT